MVSLTFPAHWPLTRKGRRARRRQTGDGMVSAAMWDDGTLPSRSPPPFEGLSGREGGQEQHGAWLTGGAAPTCTREPWPGSPPSSGGPGCHSKRGSAHAEPPPGAAPEL